MIPVHVRWLVRNDMPEVLAIEGQSFANPWTEEEFVRCLRERNCIGKVAEEGVAGGGPILGYMIYELHRNRLQLLNMAVKREYLRQSIGRQLVANLYRHLGRRRASTNVIRRKLVLEVRETNLGAQLFFQQLGFRAITLLPRFYEDTDEDAYLMQYIHPVTEPVEEETEYDPA